MSEMKPASSQGYSPPVDSEGFQCGVCLLYGRQCASCARKEAEAEAEEDQAEARADDDAAIYWGFDQADDAAHFNAVDYERTEA